MSRLEGLGLSLVPSGTGDLHEAARTQVPTVWWLSVDDHQSFDPNVASTLSDSEQATVNTFQEDQDRRLYTLAHVLLRTVFGAMHGVAPATLRLGRQSCPVCGAAHGRPYVRQPQTATQFSLTHAAGLAAMVTAPAGQVGIDVEPTVDPEVVDLLLSQLHPNEASEIAGRPPPCRPTAFTRTWVRKEALLKALGTGLARATTLDYTGDTSPELRPVGWRLGDFQPMPRHHLGVCVPGDVPVVRVHRVLTL